MRGVRSTFITSASSHTIWAASSGSIALAAAGVNGSAPGRKSTPRFAPDARGGELLDLDVGLGAGKLGLEPADHELGHEQAQRPRKLAGHDLGDERTLPGGGWALVAKVVANELAR